MISKIFLLPILSFAYTIAAQCATSGYVPCLAPGDTVAVAPPPIIPYTSTGSTGGGFGSGFWSSINSAALSPIQRRSFEETSPQLDAEISVFKRQNSLCCRPSPVECLYADGVPFCYNPSTTRLFFSDGSYAFTSNDTYYGSDGTFIDYATGVYQYPNGTTVDFTPDSSASSSAAAGGTASPSTSAAVGGETMTSVAGAGTEATTTTNVQTSATSLNSAGTTTSASGAATSSQSSNAKVIVAAQPALFLSLLGMVTALF